VTSNARKAVLGAIAALVAAALLQPAGIAHARRKSPVPEKPPVAGAERFAGGWAIPLKGEVPEWFTPRFARKVLAAGKQGVRLPAGVTPPRAVGLGTIGIRPGQWLITLDTQNIGFAWCSANFVFQKSSSYGLGTAGHCTEALGSDVTAYVVPPPGQGLPGIYNIGRISTSHDNVVGDDFAMIDIYPEFNGWMNPTMPVWGGPTGTYTSTLPTVAKHFGHGTAVGTGGTPRAGIAPILNARGGNAFAWYGIGAPGDSGSAVNAAAGEALGNFTHIIIYDGSRKKLIGEILPGMLAGTTISKILQSAGGYSLAQGSLVPVP